MKLLSRNGIILTVILCFKLERKLAALAYKGAPFIPGEPHEFR